jgi:hypothetical protein
LTSFPNGNDEFCMSLYPDDCTHGDIDPLPFVNE